MNALATARFNFETVFSAPASTVLGPEANLHAVIAERMGFSEDQDFAIGHTAVRSASEHSVGAVTFVDWEGDTPSAQVAPIYVDVYRPGFLARTAAFVRRREPNASVNIAAYGYGPLGGGDPQSAPDNRPLPDAPSRELVRV
jgi:hypothetical protein